jgi:hypothetical protein
MLMFDLDLCLSVGVFCGMSHNGTLINYNYLLIIFSLSYLDIPYLC